MRRAPRGRRRTDGESSGRQQRSRALPEAVGGTGCLRDLQAVGARLVAHAAVGLYIRLVFSSRLAKILFKIKILWMPATKGGRGLVTDLTSFSGENLIPGAGSVTQNMHEIPRIFNDFNPCVTTWIVCRARLFRDITPFFDHAEI